MALAVAVFVGDSEKWIPSIVEKAKKLKIGSGFEDVDCSPVAYAEVRLNNCKLKDRINGLLDTVE